MNDPAREGLEPPVDRHEPADEETAELPIATPLHVNLHRLDRPTLAMLYYAVGCREEKDLVYAQLQRLRLQRDAPERSCS